jgi:hypothetical protein
MFEFGMVKLVILLLTGPFIEFDCSSAAQHIAFCFYTMCNASVYLSWERDIHVLLTHSFINIFFLIFNLYILFQILSTVVLTVHYSDQEYQLPPVVELIAHHCHDVVHQVLYNRMNAVHMDIQRWLNLNAPL